MTTEACLAGNKTLETARSDEFPAVTVISAPSVTWPVKTPWLQGETPPTLPTFQFYRWARFVDADFPLGDISIFWTLRGAGAWGDDGGGG